MTDRARDVKPAGATTVPFPRERRLVLDTLALGRDKPMMHGLVEVDVTRARRRLRARREATGDAPSLTAFVLACIGHAAARVPTVHALRDLRGRLVVFDRVDASVLVEVEVEGRRFAAAHVVRAIDSRAVEAIHHELRTLRRAGATALPWALRAVAGVALRAPGVVRRACFRAFLASPTFAQRRTGSLLVSSVGMFGRGAGFGISAPGIHDLSIIIGGLVERASSRGDAPGPRELLCLTVSANHQTIDGAPLARFISDLAGRLERAEGLGELDDDDDAPKPRGGDLP